jgi:diaminopimelate epimerase
MVVNFTKMNGAGNDFVVIDNRAQTLQISPAQAAFLCDRHRGVGADGLIVLKPCSTGQADWAWDFFNSDGSLPGMCGNGSRCFARYVQKVTGAKAGFTFETRAGVIGAQFRGELVSVTLTSPHELRLNEKITLSTGATEIHSLNTGVPHSVLYVTDMDKLDVQKIGSEIRYHQHFAPKGTNANFVQLLGGNTIRVRTYERGVEGETLACGTGVTASSIITSELHKLKPPIKVHVQGGKELEVNFEKAGSEFKNVTLTGPAEFVFEGKIELADAV